MQAPSEAYLAFAKNLLDEGKAEMGMGQKKGFGAQTLTRNGKIAVLLSRRDRLVVKLPRERVDALVQQKVGDQFDPGHGRKMKQWLEVAEGHDAQWEPLAREALEFASRA